MVKVYLPLPLSVSFKVVAVLVGHGEIVENVAIVRLHRDRHGIAAARVLWADAHAAVLGLARRAHGIGGRTAATGTHIVEGDAALDGIIVLAVRRKLPLISGVRLDIGGSSIQHLAVLVHPLHRAAGPTGVGRQRGVSQGLAAGGDGRVGGCAGGGGLVHREMDRVGGGEIVHGVVRGEGPAIGRLARGGNGGEGVLPGDGAGDHRAVKNQVIISEQPNRMPGIIPPMNIRLMDAPLTTPKRINPMLGGIMFAMIADEITMPVERALP